VSQDAVEGSGQQTGDRVVETGEAEVDAALAGLAELDELPVGQHHDRLAQMHEVLHRALHPDPSS
jgi:hypothetical protein